MFISELAHKTGLRPHTIRFYEKEGLINKHLVRRGSNNYRHYADDVVDRILLIKFGQTVGFTLSEIKVIMEAADVCEFPHTEQVTLLQQKMIEVDQKIGELQHIRALLKANLEILNFAGGASDTL